MVAGAPGALGNISEMGKNGGAAELDELWSASVPSCRPSRLVGGPTGFVIAAGGPQSRCADHFRSPDGATFVTTHLLDVIAHHFIIS
jgi:hypothetical protein